MNPPKFKVGDIIIVKPNLPRWLGGVPREIYQINLMSELEGLTPIPSAYLLKGTGACDVDWVDRDFVLADSPEGILSRI